LSGTIPARQLPGFDPDTEFFWTSGAQGQLRICRCQDCARYIHPPLPRCPDCGGGTAPAAVSGKARVASYTVNEQPWRRGLAVPYVFAAVELVEQAELYVLTNIVGCPAEDLRIGLNVTVTFEQQEDVFLPLFRPDGDDHV
jgi:uncharacterized protein